MHPVSFSATSMESAEGCLSRYYHENIMRGSRTTNDAALLGTAVHEALEIYVGQAILAGAIEATLSNLLGLYEASYEAYLGVDRKNVWYKDGLEMVKRWFDRIDFSEFNVLSCEVKQNFPVPTSIGNIPFNYIYDRFDQLAEHTYRVVDYKTIRVPFTAEELKQKWQPRAYALAAQIAHPDAERIWVEFDHLRYERVGIVFSREDNIASWKYLKMSAQKIIDAPELNIPETINTGCRYCVRKASCNTLASNVFAGGIFRIASVDEAAARLNAVNDQIAGLKALESDLQDVLIKHASEMDSLEFETDGASVTITAPRRREISPDEIYRVLDDPIIFSDYSKMNLGDFDKLLKDPRVPDDKRKLLENSVSMKLGELKAKVKHKPKHP